MYFSRLLLMGCLTVGGMLPATAEDWPRFLGLQADAKSTETGLLDRWPETGPPLVWDKKIGTGYSAPSIREGRLVLHHRLKDEEIVEAFEPNTGNSLWKYAYPSKFVDPYGYNNGPRCTPLLTPEFCYTFGAEGKLLCLNVKNGQLVWQRDTQKDWEVPEAFFGVGSTPILDGNLLYVMVGGQPNSGMVAFDAKTGKTVWESVGQKNWAGKTKLDWPGEPPVVWDAYDKQASYASPVLATIHGKKHLLCLMRQGLVSLDPETGAVNFSRWFRARVNDSVNAANPIVMDDKVLITSAYFRSGAVVLKILPDGKSFEEVWKSLALEVHWTTPVLHNGFVYAFSGRNEPDANFRCVEFNTGKLKWERDERWRHDTQTPNVYGRGSAILADKKLITLGEGGLLGLFELNPEKPVEISRWQVPQLSYPVWPGPVLAHGKLYLRSERSLVCLNVAKAKP